MFQSQHETPSGGRGSAQQADGVGTVHDGAGVLCHPGERVLPVESVKASSSMAQETGRPCHTIVRPIELAASGRLCPLEEMSWIEDEQGVVKRRSQPRRGPQVARLAVNRAIVMGDIQVNIL